MNIDIKFLSGDSLDENCFYNWGLTGVIYVLRWGIGNSQDPDAFREIKSNNQNSASMLLLL